MRASLDIIIVNWNTGTQLQECLESITASGLSSLDIQRVVVVDNASTDGIDIQLDTHRLPLVLIRNNTNRGFAAACNQGASGSHAQFLLFLNPDTRIAPDTLEKAVDQLQCLAEQDVGILSVALHRVDGSLACTCARFPTLPIILCEMLGLSRLFPELFPGHFMTRRDPATSGVVDQVIGAFFLVHRNLFEELAGFDERFFVYYEEVDFAKRAREKGRLCFYFAGAAAVHEGGGSSRQAGSNRLFYLLRSRLLYCRKHLGWTRAAVLTLATLIVEPWVRLTSDILRCQWNTAAHNVLAAGKLWLTAPKLLLASAERQPREQPDD